MLYSSGMAMALSRFFLNEAAKEDGVFSQSLYKTALKASRSSKTTSQLTSKGVDAREKASTLTP